MGNLKCACGSYLESRSGKFGPYFHCINCGNINFRKAMEMNEGSVNNKPVDKKVGLTLKERKRYYETSPKEITVTSDELDFI